MTPAIVDAAAALVAEGHDTETVSSLLLNGAVALVLERCTEAEFVERARKMWRTAERQLELLSLLDRIGRQKGVTEPFRSEVRNSKPCPPERTLRQGQTS